MGTYLKGAECTLGGLQGSVYLLSGFVVSSSLSPCSRFLHSDVTGKLANMRQNMRALIPPKLVYVAFQETWQ